MQLNFCRMKFIILISCLIVAEGSKQFHEDLSREHLRHYFGTPVISKVPEYEFIEPQLVKRHRRSSASGDEAQYYMKAFGTEYHLHLQQNQDLLSPGCLVLRELGNNTREVRPCPLRELTCVYHGHVSNHNDSWAAVSTCIGVHGIISVPGHDLMIQPIKEQHLHRVRRDTSADIPHIVYRRQTKTESKCGTQEAPKILSNEDRRTKRSTSDTKYIALKVVLAPDSVKFHGSDAERYLSTAVNIAAHTFRDPSLGHDIRIRIVEISLLNSQNLPIAIVPDSTELLNNFCFWQETSLPPESSPRHPDGIVFITKEDLYYNGDGTNLGLGSVKGMCKPNYRCSVNEDNGLDLGLTIAHETGHTLGMGHDHDKGCPGGKFIMSGSGATGPSALTWSTCSKRSLEEFLRSSESNCLNDEPAIPDLNKVDYSEKPGLLYSANDQCKLAMDDESNTVCTGTTLTAGNECKMLVCYTRDKKSCAGVGSLRMNGTECGHRKWCISGECMDMGAGSPRAVNGGWSGWDSEWSPCSRSCGGGIKTRHRKCTEPEPRFGGRECQGEDVMAQICNIQTCQTSEREYREQQCAATNSESLNGMTYNWKPFDEKCGLRCYAEHTNIVSFRGNSKYNDGTECEGQGSFSRCVDSKCQEFGCDGHMGSNIQFDACLVCNGNGKTCSVHQGTYNQGKEKEFVTFATIPKDATSVEVTNTNKYSFMTVKYGSHLFFGDNGQRPFSGTFSYNHLAVKYRRTGPEKIEILGPLPFSIELQVWRVYGPGYLNVDPQITYTYYTRNSAISEYRWRSVEGACSKSCGTGEAVINVLCEKISSHGRVDNKFCNIFLRPDENLKKCNTHDCPPEWHSEDWGRCSKTCSGGTQIRSVRCVVIQGDSYTAVADNRCNLNHKPVHSQQCNVHPCPGVWRTSHWSQCSKTCGKGTRSRTVHCYKSEHSNELVEEVGCGLNQKPAANEHCIDAICNMNIKGAACHDIVDCTGYADDVCEAYGAWAQKNCMEFCGVCAKDPTVFTCKDVLRCTDYGSNMCKGYPEFWQKNCAKSCGLCSGGSVVIDTPNTTGECADMVDCRTYQNDICTSSHYKSWVTKNCAKHCGICHVIPCEDKVDCGAYQDDICTNINFKAWAKRHCNQFCGFCSSGYLTTTTQSTPTTTEPFTSCVDKLNCAAYANDICTSNQYRTWAKINCQKHCGWCAQATSPVSLSVCSDKINCANYAADICINTKYKSWALQNCKKHCGFCHLVHHITTIQSTTSLHTTTEKGYNSCSDEIDCSKYAHDICTNHQYGTWAHINCRKYCGFCHSDTLSTAPTTPTTIESTPASHLCTDKTNCAQYALDICTKYKPWAKQNCAKHCRFCNTFDILRTTPTTTSPTTTASTTPTTTESTPASRSCIDRKNCARYAQDICTKYKAWAEENCAKHCRFCNTIATHHLTTPATTTAHADCVDKVDCSQYASDVCTSKNYKAWAALNCRKHCGICSVATHHLTTPVTTTAHVDCIDKVDCSQYASDVCTSNSYKSWAALNCRKHCGFCSVVLHTTAQPKTTPTVKSDSCADKIDCSSYQNDICTNEQYKTWATQNCAKHCKICGGSQVTHSNAECVDKVDCSSYQDDICTNDQYIAWARQNCAKHCDVCGVGDALKHASTTTPAPHGDAASSSSHGDPCQDAADCSSYQDDVCTAYKTWATQNCRRTCGVCKPCTDKVEDCPDYGKGICEPGSQYRPWAKLNCPKFCDLCGTRKKRSLKEQEDNLEKNLDASLAPNQIPKPIIVHDTKLQLTPIQKTAVKNSDELVMQPIIEVPPLRTPIKINENFEIPQPVLRDESKNDIVTNRIKDQAVNKAIHSHRKIPSLAVLSTMLSLSEKQKMLQGSPTKMESIETGPNKIVNDGKTRVDDGDMLYNEGGRAPVKVPAPEVLKSLETKVELTEEQELIQQIDHLKNET